MSAKEILSLADDMCQTLNLPKSTLIKVYRGSKTTDIIMYQERQYYGASQKINVNQVDRLVQHLMIDNVWTKPISDNVLPSMPTPLSRFTPINAGFNTHPSPLKSPYHGHLATSSWSSPIGAQVSRAMIKHPAGT